MRPTSWASTCRRRLFVLTPMSNVLPRGVCLLPQPPRRSRPATDMLDDEEDNSQRNSLPDFMVISAGDVEQAANVC